MNPAAVVSSEGIFEEFKFLFKSEFCDSIDVLKPLIASNVLCFLKLCIIIFLKVLNFGILFCFDNVTVLLCGHIHTNLGISMPSEGGHIIKALEHYQF